MKWNRVLNSFIIVFILANGFLFVLGRMQAVHPEVLSAERSSQLGKIMSQKGVSIYDNYPTFESRSVLQATIKKFDEPAIAEKIIGKDYTVRETETSIVYGTDQGQITFYKDMNLGTFVYATDKPQYLKSTGDVNKLIKDSQAWIEGFLGKDKVYDIQFIEGDANNLTLELHQVYEEESIYFNTIKLRFNESGLVEASVRDFDLKGFVGSKLVLKPVDEVLYKFVDQMQEQGMTSIIIKSIRIGYELGPEATDSVDGTVEAVPYYIIRLADGDIYYIDAYTNENRTI